MEISICFKEEEYLTYGGSKPNMEDLPEYLKYELDFQKEFDNIINNSNVPEAYADFTPDMFDKIYLNFFLAIPRDGDGPKFSKVTKRLRDKGRLPIGKDHNNPIFVTKIYEVEYKYGHKASLVANAISDNMFAQFYEEVN